MCNILFSGFSYSIVLGSHEENTKQALVVWLTLPGFCEEKTWEGLNLHLKSLVFIFEKDNHSNIIMRVFQPVVWASSSLESLRGTLGGNNKTVEDLTEETNSEAQREFNG